MPLAAPLFNMFSKSFTGHRVVLVNILSISCPEWSRADGCCKASCSSVIVSASIYHPLRSDRFSAQHKPGTVFHQRWSSSVCCQYFSGWHVSAVMERRHYKQRAVHLIVTEESYLSVNLSDAVPLWEVIITQLLLTHWKNSAGGNMSTHNYRLFHYIVLFLDASSKLLTKLHPYVPVSIYKGI